MGLLDLIAFASKGVGLELTSLMLHFFLRFEMI